MVRGTRYILLFIVLLIGLTFVPLNDRPRADQSKTRTKTKRAEAPRFEAIPSSRDDGFILREVEGQLACTDSTSRELEAFRKRDPNQRLRQINHLGDEIRAQETGLTIILRSTAQLDANAAAKQAFINAAARWEALIQDQITIIVDVDFGPTRFGTPYDDGVLGATLSQRIGSSANYLDIKSRLVARASSEQETTLYNALPSPSVPTDIGSTEGVLAPSAVFRALGAISPVADPQNEPSLGNPPSIGFNSAFTFDFDPSNGISPDTTDFDAVAVHELGHVLGFSSMVGSKELTPTEPVFIGMLDMFRLAPGATLGSFMTNPRILSSGASHNLFTGSEELPLSTGRPRSPLGGDGRQASHWKDDFFTGSFIGIMDPTLPTGQREEITSNDLKALDLFGYSLMGSAPPPPPDDTVALTSGVAQPGSIAAPPPNEPLLGDIQYSIVVPAGTNRLRVELSGDQDVDLYVRFGAKIVIDDVEDVLADYLSTSVTGNEVIVITPGSDPPLQQGTYFIAVDNFGPGAAEFSVTATVSSGESGSPPTLSNLAASLTGDVLRLTGTVMDPDGDILNARSNLLNGSDQVIATSGQFAVDFGDQTSLNFTIDLEGLSAFPSALKATLEFIDDFGNRSSVVTADFSLADSGGPTLKNVTYNGSKMVIKGKKFIGSYEIEVNGTVVGMGNSSNKKKIKLNGNASALNVRMGDNRVGIRINSLRSNLLVFNH